MTEFASSVGRRPKRRHSISRLEGFSDAVFAFSSTLLVVSLEVPRTLPELLGSLQGFVAFALSFGALVLIWFAHNNFFRRYGLDDGPTVFWNGVLLFVVLFYVYPLKYMTTTFVGNVLGFDRASSDGMITSFGELSSLFIVYGIGFSAVFASFSRLYHHALARAEALGLDELERHEAKTLSEAYLILAGVGLGSIGLAWAEVGLRFGLPGMFYGSIGLFTWFHGRYREKQRRAIEARLGALETSQ